MGKFLEGLILGALTGAAIVLFTAPQSGSQTQETIRQRVNLVLEEGRRARRAPRRAGSPVRAGAPVPAAGRLRKPDRAVLGSARHRGRRQGLAGL